MPPMPPMDIVKPLCDILDIPFNDEPRFVEYFATALRLPGSPPQRMDDKLIFDGNEELAHLGVSAMNVVVSKYGLDMHYPTRKNDDNRRNKLNNANLATAFDKKPSFLSLVCRNPCQPVGDLSEQQKATMVQAIAGAACYFGEFPLTEQIMRSFDIFPS